MRFLQLVFRVSWRNQLRNDDIRHMFGIYNLNEKIMPYRQDWRDHVARMHRNEYLNKF